MPTWRLRPPNETRTTSFRRNLTTQLVVESTVAGDNVTLASYGDGQEIPEGTPNIWFGGHINTTDDEAVKSLWESNGYTVEAL